MRIAVITQGVSNVFESIIESGHEVVGIVECSRTREPNSFLKAIGGAFTDVYYSFTSRPLNLKNFSKKLKIPYYYLRKGDNETFQKWMKHLQPDIIVVYSMSHLLKENIFTIPKLGTINLHYSHLPEYRGPSPLFWEYYDYILNPGVTLHYINKGEDTGDIIFQERILISSGDKLEEVVKKLSLTGIKFLLKTMDMIESGDVPRIKQSATTPTVRARKIKPGEYSELIKWDDWGVERVFHFLSGTPKYHYTLMKKPSLHKLGFTIKILNKEKCNTSGYKVGKLYKENSKNFLVCKNGKIYVDVIFSPASFLARIYPYIC